MLKKCLVRALADNVRAQNLVCLVHDDPDHTDRVALTNSTIQPRVGENMFVCLAVQSLLLPKTTRSASATARLGTNLSSPLFFYW